MRLAAWRRRSLRGRLLVWLLTLHLVVGGLTAWFSYGVYGRVIHHFMDDQMRLLADSYADQAVYAGFGALAVVASAVALARSGRSSGVHVEAHRTGGTHAR